MICGGITSRSPDSARVILYGVIIVRCRRARLAFLPAAPALFRVETVLSIEGRRITAEMEERIGLARFALCFRSSSSVYLGDGDHSVVQCRPGGLVVRRKMAVLYAIGPKDCADTHILGISGTQGNADPGCLVGSCYLLRLLDD